MRLQSAGNALYNLTLYGLSPIATRSKIAKGMSLVCKEKDVVVE
jgi:hypothetical protein